MSRRNFQFPISNCQLQGGRGSPWSDRQSAIGNRQFGFTLVEMVVVVAIVIVIVTLVVPGATAMWRQRRIADAQNTISGQLMSARALALQGGRLGATASFIQATTGSPPVQIKLEPGEETGLFFFVDREGVQRVVPIVQVTPALTDTDDPGRRIRRAWANVFGVVGQRAQSLPAPMRVVPRYAVCEDLNNKNTCTASPPQDFELFAPAELANDSIEAAPGDQAQRHRNFFALIYSADGQLIVNRDVLIRDPDDVDEEAADARGDVTGLKVTEEITHYHSRNKTPPRLPSDINPGGVYEDVELVADADGTALNFPSVDGLLVYDESLFVAAGDATEKRRYLVDSAWPFYVHRLTGTVIRGPVGEAVAAGP